MARNKKYDIDEDDEFEISPRETLTGQDYVKFMGDVIKSRNDPSWFVKNILEIELFPKQEDLLRRFYQHKYDPNLPINKKFICGAGMRCLTGNTLILTQNGYRRLDSIVPDNAKEQELIPVNNLQIYNSKNWTNVEGCCYCGKKPLTTVTTEYGYKLSGSIEHKIYCWDGTSKFEWKSFKDLSYSDYIEIDIGISNEGNNRYTLSEIDNIKNIYYKGTLEYNVPSEFTVNQALVMGYLIAEGTITRDNRIDFTNGDEETRNDFKKSIESDFGECPITTGQRGYELYVCHSWVAKFFHAIGIGYGNAYTKKIPEIIWRSTKDRRAAFLSAYFEGDGTVSIQSDGSKSVVECYTVSNELAHQIQLLLLEFGILSSISITKSRNFGTGGSKRDNNCYSVRIHGEYICKFNDLIGFRSQRKIKSLEIAVNNVNSKKLRSTYLPVSKTFAKKYLTYTPSFHSKESNPISKVNKSTVSKTVKLNDEISSYLISGNRLFLQVKSVEFSDELVDMYDLYVPDSNCYVANGILSHNSGKTVLASAFGIYEFFEVISWDNPAAHFGLLKNQEIFITAVATSKQLAQDGIFANCRNHMEENEWFNQWFDFEFKESRVDCRNKHAHMQVLGSWATTAVGRSNKCVVFDELALLEKTDGKRGANEVYTRLSASTATFGLHGKIVAISSPQTHNDIIMSLYRTGLNEEHTVASLEPTWVMNPNFTEEDLREECKFDMNRFYRDFACQPSAGGGVQFPDGVNFNREITNVLQNTKWHDIETYQSRVMAIDPAVKKDAFGIATGYMNNDGITIDGVRAFYKEEDQNYISPRDIWEFIKEASIRLNVYTLIFDTWLYMEVIEKSEQELGINVIKHIVDANNYDTWLEMQNAEHQVPLKVVYDPYLEREVDNLMVTSTPTGKKKVDHPKIGTGKDLADCVANIIWYFTNSELEELDNVTPIGRGAVVF